MRKSNVVRRFSSVAALVALVAGAACSTGSSSTAGQVTLTFSSWEFGDPASQKQLTQLTNQFQSQNPGIKVSPIAIQFLDYQPKLTTLIGAGQAPDVIAMYVPWVAQFAGIGALQNLDSYVTDAIKQDTQGIDQGTAAGHIYGLTNTLGTGAMFVNKTVLQKAGLDPATPIKTWSDLQNVCSAVVSKAGVSCIAITSQKEPSVFYWWQPLLKAYGGDVFSSAGKCILNNSAGVAFMVEMKKWMDQKWLTSGIDATAARQVFAQDKAAILFDGPWMKAILRDNSGKGAAFDNEWYVTTYPQGPIAPQPVTALASHQYSIGAQSQHKAEAWKLVQFLIQPSTELTFYKSFGDTPASKAASADPSLTGDPYLSAFTADTAFAGNPPFSAQWPSVSDFWMQGMEEIFNGRNAQQALDAACNNIVTVQPSAK